MRDNVALACMFGRRSEGLDGARLRAVEYLDVVGLTAATDAPRAR